MESHRRRHLIKIRQSFVERYKLAKQMGDKYYAEFFKKQIEKWIADKTVSKYYERYIYICLFKYNITIGWLWR